MFKLTKEYGDVSLIPEEDLARIQNLALKENERLIETQVHEEKLESPKLPNASITFEPYNNQDIKRGNPSLNYEALWEAYPKRLMAEDGHKWGVICSRCRIQTQEQYDEALRIIKAYFIHTKKQYGKDQSKFSIKYDNFIQRIEDFAGLKGGQETVMERTRVQRPWARPFRPLFPWEPEPRDPPDVREAKGKLASSLTFIEKRRIEEELKIAERYNDKDNDRYWYYAR